MELIEFTKLSTGVIIYNGYNKEPQVLKPNDKLVQKLLDKVKTEYPLVYIALEELYPKKRNIDIYHNYLIVNRFISCNFGDFDLKNYDISLEGDFEFEEVNCPLRGGLCPHEGIICKPIPVNLSTREVEVLALLAQGFIIKDIATILEIAVDTVISHRANIFKKLNVSKTVSATAYYNKFFKL